MTALTARTTCNRLQVATVLHKFIEEQVLPGTGIDSASFWKGFDAIAHDLAPKNAALLAERDRLQTELDKWHHANPGPIGNMDAYRDFLKSIGYLVPAPAQVAATTSNVDAELALQAGPQLVVPILNARYALNAANARWGSLYDALGHDYALVRTNPTVDVSALLNAAQARGIPMRVVDLTPQAADHIYKEALVLSRPDQHVAWRGHQLPDDIDALLNLISGTAKEHA